LTERTSTKSVGRFRQASGIDPTTSDSDEIDVHNSMTSISASRNAVISLQSLTYACIMKWAIFVLFMYDIQVWFWVFTWRNECLFGDKVESNLFY